MKYEIRQIDAWNDGEGWFYNETWKIGEYETNAQNEKKAFSNALRKHNIFPKRGCCRIDFDGDIYELVNRKDGCPLFCSVPLA